MKRVEIRTEPDKPIGFGRKNLWIAAKVSDAPALASALELQEVQTANWRSGFVAAYAFPSDYVFVTPPLGGWVLAVGSLPDPSAPTALPHWRHLMSRVSSRFGEAQFFATHRGSSYTAWGHYRDGTERRLFAYGDEPIYNIGEPFPEEAELITQLPDPTSRYWERDDWRRPGEDDVFRLARAWSFDPSELDSADLPVSVGVVGRLITKPGNS
jgi:hypothetical protein